MKPLIKFDRAFGWKCIGDGWIGCGATMKQAYYEWQFAVLEYGDNLSKWFKDRNNGTIAKKP